MDENTKRCMGCMNETNQEGQCERCGYIDGTPYLPSYLAPKTILNDRYLVGKLLSYNGESATYIGYDNVKNEKVYIREFMPDVLCNRVRGSSIISVNPNKLVQYKNYMSEFTELNKSLSKMRTLSHINPALDLFAQNNTTYSILEYIDGITLKHYLQDNAGELSWQQVKKLFPPIFTTLNIIHNAGIVHRGISLDTIYYTSKGELKITGFCISGGRTANSELAPELYVGFAAPEQYSSTEWQGTWTDVYALSAVLYRVLTGCMPTDAVSRIGNDSLHEPASISGNIPKNVSKVIMAGLKLNGDLRIQTITEFVTKLFDQPEYMEETRSNTSTIIIPRQTLPNNSNQVVDDRKPLSKTKLSMIIAVSTFLVLLVILILVFVLFSNGDDNSPTFNNSIMESSHEDDFSSDLSSEESSIIETTQTTQSSEVAADTIAMPDLVNSNYDIQSNSQVLKEWIELVPSYEYNEQFPSGTILSQDVEKDKDIVAGTKVNVRVSKGSQFVTVPDFEGVSKKDYIAKLDSLSIKYEIKDFVTNEVMVDYVARTSKLVDEKIDLEKNETLIVYIAVAPLNDINSFDY